MRRSPALGAWGEVFRARRGECGESPADGVPKLVLPQGGGEVAAGLLQDAADGVGGPAQTAGHGVGVVEGDEGGVDIIHLLEDRLAALELSAPDHVQNV